MFAATHLIGFASGATQVMIPGATGTAIGNMTSIGGLAALFDGTNDKAAASCARGASSSTDSGGGKDWGSGNTKILTAFDAYPSNDLGFNNSGGLQSVRMRLQGSTDNFSASVVDLYDETFTEALSVKSVTSGITTTTGYRYHRLWFDAAAGAFITAAQFVFYENV